MEEKLTATAQKIYMVELFAGVGGFRLAADKSKVVTLLWNQWEPGTKTQYAQYILREKFGDEGYHEGFSDVPIEDAVQKIKQGELTHLSEVDLLVGGFPCQDYSVAKSKSSALGLKGRKGVLWWPMLELIEHLEPKFVFLENVDRLLKSPANQRGRDFAVMLRTLGNLGYLIEWRIIDSSEYGANQRRKRIFIIARKLSQPEAGLKMSYLQAEDIICKKGVLARSFGVIGLHSGLQEIKLPKSPVSISKNFGKESIKSQFQNAGVYLNGVAFTGKVSPRRRKPGALGNVLVDEKLVDELFYVDESDLDKWRKLKEGGKKLRYPKVGEPYYYAEGPMSLVDDLDRPSRTIVTGEGGSTPSRFKHLIKINGRYRRLIPIELERLNGFPRNHTKKGIGGVIVPDTKRAFLMGNALVVPIVRRAINVIISELEGIE